MRFPTKVATIVLLMLPLSSKSISAQYCVEDVAEEIATDIVDNRARQSNMRLEVVQYIPRLSLTASLEHRDLIFTDEENDSYSVARLSPGADYGGWRALYELEGNWLYVGGSQYDHLVQVAKNSEERWTADQIIRIQRPRGIVARFTDWFFGRTSERKRIWNLSSIIYVDDDPRYSPALKRIIFSELGSQTINGNLVPLDGDDEMRYVGDIERLRLAIFKSEEEIMLSYDGKYFSEINGSDSVSYRFENGIAKRGIFYDLKHFGRTFYRTWSSLYEIREEESGLSISEIEFLNSVILDIGMARILPSHDMEEIVVLTKRDIFILDDMTGLFPRTESDGWINVWGSNALPAAIPELDGILFSTGGHQNSGHGTKQFHLLTRCSPP